MLSECQSPCLVVSIVFLCLIGAHSIHGSTVHLWSDINFQGQRYELNLVPGNCYPLTPRRVSSLSTNGACVDLFTRDDCFGGTYRMEAHTSECKRNFGDCDMNDQISSVRLCPRCRNTCYGQYGLIGVTQNVNERVCNCECNCHKPCTSVDYGY